ncbi:unnamed protein product [Tilletia caries]|uniref:Uncharacterized protein n=1 Tax=Tilletia caries TaxID=13290 RepID=A0ABN7J1Y6_9BASI|nr:unnamed protein product [Tilletia caries]
MAKGSKTRSNYVPRGPSPDIQPAPGPSGDAASPVAGRVGHVRSASTAFGEPDEVLNVSIVPEVLAIAKRARLSNSATNKLHELSEAVVAEQDLDDESNFSLHAPSSFLLAQSLVLANWDLLRTLNRKASSTAPAEASNGPRPKTQPAAAALDPNMLSSDAKESTH